MTAPAPLWTSGTATGVGSLPGTDLREAARLVLDLLPVPHLPELPARGHHADLAGRGVALLSDLWADVQPSGWRVVPRPSREGQRARDLLARDLDAFEEVAESAPPAVLKVQATGPWTLTTVLELQRGAKVLADHGAVADLVASLAEGLSQHLADLQRRFPATTLVLQLDEPALPAVLAARIPTASGFATLRAPSPQTAREHLATVLAVAEHTVVHCCAPRPPVALLVEARAGALSVDAAMLDPRDDDALGQALEGGTGLLLGVVPGAGHPLPGIASVVRAVGRLRDRVGVTDVTLTPTCGLAGATPDQARRAMERLVAAATEVAEVAQQ